jgi:opacity protein-like surface antigen
MFSLAMVLAAFSGLPGGMGIGVGTSVSSFSPVEESYDLRFRTPGISYGIVASLDAPGPLVFHLGGEYFSKKASSGWDGEISSMLYWAFPCGQLSVMDGFSVFGGPGIVGVSGSYSGTDDFGSFIEEDGSSVGFAASAGTDIALWGPVSARLEYRYGWMDMKSDRVIKDGAETVVYPAAETDLGYSQYIFSLNVQLSAVDDRGI